MRWTVPLVIAVTATLMGCQTELGDSGPVEADGALGTYVDAAVGRDARAIDPEEADGFLPVDGCRPRGCVEAGASCGPVDDGCGASIDCGTCEGGAACVDNRCDSACMPLACGSACGSVADGCGGTLSCGSCAEPEECNSNVCRVPGRFEVEMTISTVNIGRDYSGRAQMAGAVARVRDVLLRKSGPNFVGWQEIGEGDPCGGCEIEVVRNHFTDGAGWTTRHPRGRRPDGALERVKVPITSRRSHDPAPVVRAAFASPGWAGVSPTRFVTVAHYPQRNLSVINTHLIAGAWSCRSQVDRRRRYWRQAWQVLRDEVTREHAAGRNVFVTGDLNRPRGANGCNPAWDPTNLHPSARIIGGSGIDYVFAVPAASWQFRFARRSDDSIERDSIHIGIDGHRGHWVRGRFVYRD